MQNSYKIYCEDVNREVINTILEQNFEGYTITPGMGFYGGKREKSIVIEVFGTTRSAVNRVCNDLATALNQQQVIFTETPCNVNFSSTISTKVFSA